MAKRTVGRDKLSVPPSFFIPDGVDEFEYQSESVEDDASEEYDEIGEETDELSPVYTITIVSQTPKKSDDGLSTVVDVVVEVTDTVGADNYELRVAKV